MHSHSETDHDRALRSWRGRWLLDGFENRIGCVENVEVEETGVTLSVRFAKNDKRTISSEPRPDGEFAHPDLVRARYRVLSEDQAREFLRKRRSSSSSS